MDGYKKIIRSAKLRREILNLLSFIPDETMLKMQYRIKLGRPLNLKNPRRFTEKLQWYKLNYRNPVLHQCVDKYKVREYIKSKGLEDILVKLIAHYSSLDDINWDEVPNSFVIKTTNGGGGVNVVICKDKESLKKDVVLSKLDSGNKKFKPNSGGREWAYYGLEPGIIVEELLINEENPKAGINDYKILCFGGKPKCIIVDTDRYIGHKRNFYDLKWKNLHVTSDCPGCNHEIQKPENLDEMLHIAETLSKDFPFVRVDLYNCSGKIYFGELTFYPWSGYVKFFPDTFDYYLGEKFLMLGTNRGGREKDNINSFKLPEVRMEAA